MPDLEKVIKGLECFTNVYPSTTWGECKERNCSYLGKDCELEVMADALSLLKAQEQKIEPIMGQKEIDFRSEIVPVPLCGNCRYELDRYDGWQYCPVCGKAVLWRG